MILRLNSVKAWAEWDMLEHEKMTERLKEDGICPEKLYLVGEKMQIDYFEMEPQDYYTSVLKGDDLFSKPFGLYSNHI